MSQLCLHWNSGYVPQTRMLGILFDEGNSWGTSQRVSIPEHGSADKMVQDESPLPPSPRANSLLSGLENRGATCYLNSLLQTLLYTPEFREALLKIHPNELGIREDETTTKVQAILMQLQRLFARLLLANRSVISTAELINSFGWTNQEELEQQDVQELNHSLLNALESSLVGTSGEDIISRLYRGILICQISCKECGSLSELEESFLDINVSVSNSRTLEKGLQTAFLDGEDLIGMNKYLCQTCGQLVEAKKTVKIRHLPKILTFVLLRFRYDTVKLQWTKDTSEFLFPMSINMVSYLEQENISLEDTEYQLISVVIHRGESFGGHYHAYIKDLDGLGHWAQDSNCDSAENYRESFELDKSSVDLNSPRSVLLVILLRQPQLCLSLQKLACEIKKITGSSWNKAFRKQHGPIHHYVSSSSDILDYCSETDLVSLKNVLVHGENIMSNLFQNTSTAQQIIDESQKDENLCDSQCSQCCWFDFDDASVKPVKIREIMHQFSGDECAYLLIYRRKFLKRPHEAFNNPSYNVPAYLAEMVELENKELDKERMEYEMLLNSISVAIVMGNLYQRVNGCLVSVNNADEGPVHVVVVDKRMTYGEFCDKVMQVGGHDNVCSGFTLTVAKELVTGLHLYQNIRNDCSTISLDDLGIDHDMMLFLWDGEHIDGALFGLCGEEHEPVLLNIAYASCPNDSVDLVHAFPKSLSLMGLLMLVADLVSVPANNLSLSWLKSSCNSLEDRIPITTLHEESTLGELNFSDGDQLWGELFTNVKLSHTEPVRTTKLLCLTIKDCRQGFETHKCQMLVNADEDMTVLELKLKILEKLGETCITNCRLRMNKVDVYPVPPLYEDCTIFNLLSVAPFSTVMIENGVAPVTGQYVLTFRIPGNDKSHEVIVFDSCTAEQCLRKMVNAVHLKGGDWCLRRTVWGNEPGDVLQEMDKSLRELGVRNGEEFLVDTKAAVDTTRVLLNVWYYPTYVDASADKWMSCQYNISVVRLDELQTFFPLEPTKLGALSVLQTCTLIELKQHILSLPLLKRMPTPHLAQIRVRKIWDGRLTSILRGHNNNLKDFNVIDGCDLSVQILVSCEDLGPDSIVVSTMQRCPDSRSYFAPKEMVINFTCTPRLETLREMVASYLQLPVDHLVIAKRLNESYEWKILSENENEASVEQYVGERRQMGSPLCDFGVRVGNVILYDGDVLGVKDFTVVTGAVGDFSTDDDDLVKLEWLMKKQTLECDIYNKKKVAKQDEMRCCSGHLNVDRHGY